MRRGLSRSCLIGLFLIGNCALSHAAQGESTVFKSAGQAQVVEVLNGAAVRLASGDTVRLAALDAPRIGGRTEIPWPHAAAARKALRQLLRDRTVRMFHAGRRVDRYGRLIVHLVAGDLWVQKQLVRDGHARVRSYADNRLRVGELLAAEAAARRERKGLWVYPRYAIRSPETVTRDLDSWQIVEGVVADVAALRRTTYLNFGANWRTDFTVQINARARRLFRKAAIDLSALKGRKIRVRGWVVSRNGPLIVATHPEQLEILTKLGRKP